LKDEERFAGEKDALAEFKHEAAVGLLDEYRRTGSMDRLYSALNSAGEAIKLHSEKAGYWITLGDIHSEMSKFNILGSHEYSIESYEQALELDPDNAAAMVLLGIKLAEDGEYREALDNLERAVEREILVLSPNVLKWMNVCYLNGAQTKRGTIFFDGILKDNPGYFYLHLNKAILYRAHFDYKSARIEIVEILNDSRADEKMQEQAIKFLSELKEPDETGQGGQG
jgi:tetratricopeptide (TPR) repeat protein